LPEEYVVWEGRPSQVIHLPVFFLCGLLALAVVPIVEFPKWRVLLSLAVVPIAIAFGKWLEVRCTSYQLTSERLRVGSGVLSRTIDELELYRVKDTRFHQPLPLRLFGLANLTLTTSDRSDPVILLHAIRDAAAVREKIRTHVEQVRVSKGVREVEVE
jgi:uncharacterized membrane protein YdbT with pleckstrin-like domain